MIINPEITEKELNKIIQTTNSARKPLLCYVIILTSISSAVFLEYMFYLNTNSVSLVRFSMLCAYITAFTLGTYYILNKASINACLSNLEYIMESMIKDDWSSSFSNIKSIHPLILKHPVFKSVIGLYVYRYGREKEGLALIEKAALELSCINSAVENGKITNKHNFIELKTIIINDLYPGRFIKAYNLVTIIAIVVVFISLIAITIAFFCK